MGRDITLTFGTDAVIAPLPAGTVRIIVVGDLAPTTNTANISDLLLSYYDDPNTSMLVTSADNVYEQAAPSDFDNCVLTPYVLRNNAQWVYPTTGHHDWGDSGVQGLTSTIHSPADGLAVWLDGIQSGLVYGKNVWYYTHDIPAAKWRIIHLSGTTNMGSHIVTSAGNPIIPNTTGTTQNTWLGARLDEAVNLNYCVLVVWSDPYLGTTDDHHSDEILMKPFWDLIYAKVPNQALVICGHKHNYERFYKMDNTGAIDTTAGVPTIVAGTGGNGHYGFTGTPITGSLVRNSTDYGVVELTLSDKVAATKFVLTDGTSGDSVTWTLDGVTKPSSGTIIGSSFGPSIPFTIATMTNLHMTRTYNAGQLSGVPSGVAVHHSIKPTAAFATRDLTAGSAYLAQRDSIRAVAAGIEDIPNCYFGLWHEPENDDPRTQTSPPTASPWSTQWVNWQVNCSLDVIPHVNSTRTNPLRLTGTLIGASFNSTLAAVYLNATCLAAIDNIGIDTYASSSLNSGIAFAKSKSMPYSFPEHGNTLGSKGTTDASTVTKMNTDQTDIDNSGTKPAYDLWFNQYYNTLVGTLNSAIVVGQTSAFTLNTTALPSGSAILFEPGTARAETLTVGSYTGGPPEGTGAGPMFYPITTAGGAKFAHANGTKIYARPNALAVWIAK